MKTKMPILALILALVLILAVTSVALANGVEIPRWVLSGGATESGGGTVTLTGTIGQPFVGAASGGDVTLGHGFWAGAAMDNYTYMPMVFR